METNLFYKLITKLPVGKRTVFKIVSKLFPTEKFVSAKVRNVFLTLDLSEVLDKEYFLGRYDREELEFLENAMSSEGVFIDIGANQGFYSLTIAKKFPNARIVAIEPDPYSVEKFLANIDNNKVANIDLIQKGVSDKNESRALMINTSGNRGGNSVVLPQINHTNSDAETIIIIDCETLQNAIMRHNLQYISAIKIDIEGFEYPVLKKFFEDAPVSLWPKRIVLEHFQHIDSLVNGSSVQLLKENGYKTAKICGQNYLMELNRSEPIVHQNKKP